MKDVNEIKLRNYYSPLHVEDNPVIKIDDGKDKQIPNPNTTFQQKNNSNVRPNVCITENYIENQTLPPPPNILPGNREYANVLKNDKKV